MNKNTFNLPFTISPYLVYVLLIVFLGGSFFSHDSLSASSINNEATLKEIRKQRLSIDKMEQNFTKVFFTTLIKQNDFKQKKYHSIDAINQAINETKGPLYTVGVIINNLKVLKNNYDHPDIYTYINLLLDSNEIESALSLIRTIEQEADVTTITHSHYLLAHFYFKRQQWETSLKYLQEDGLNLATETYQHRLLIKGFALQKLSQHSLAQNTYEKIPKNSRYYYAAAFNIALVNLRQGWWSQANNIIQTLSKDVTLKNNEASLNRLYITLGYSLLKKGYYRHASSAFKHVGLSSHYANQALIGIALTAAQQEDYISALHASRLLKSKSQDDLAIDEAHLLMPFFYEKSQQWMTASVGYAQASNYYQQKITAITALLTKPINIQQYPVNIGEKTTIVLDSFQLDLSADYPPYFFENNANLASYQPWLDKIKNNKLNQQFKKLQHEYMKLTQEMASVILNKKRDNLNSYLDQTRYGLARLFDNNTVQQ